MRVIIILNPTIAASARVLEQPCNTFPNSLTVIVSCGARRKDIQIMDRRSRFSPDPVLQSLRARAVSQPPRSTTTPEYPLFAFPEVGVPPQHRSAQSPARDRPWGQRLGRSPAAVSRIPQGQLRSASFSATAHPPENDIWPPGGSRFQSTFEEDDEESLDAWTDFTGQPRSWANSDSRYRSQIPGARSRSLVPTHGLSPVGLNGQSRDWNDNIISHSIDQRLLNDTLLSRANGSRAQSFQGTSSMPATLSPQRDFFPDTSNLSPFVRERVRPRPSHDNYSNGIEPWSSFMAPMREEEPSSGTTSRRHSVSIVQPRARGVGFTVPGIDDTLTTRIQAPTNLGRSTFSDEELAGDFDQLNLNSGTLQEQARLTPHMSGTMSFPYASSRPVHNPYPHVSATNQISQAFTTIDTHLPPSIHTPSDGRSPVNERSLSTGKPSSTDQLGVTRLHRTGDGSPHSASRSRDISPVRPDNLFTREHQKHDLGYQVTEVVPGVALDEVPRTSRLVLLEFKLNRKEVFFCDGNLDVKQGDRMIVEGDRGKDIGVVVDPDVERHWLTQSGVDLASGGHHVKAKRAYGIAGPQEAEDLAKKEEDEQKALQLCQNKVRQKKLPMQVVDCEFQWDRRKLTFYFIAESRIDFRDLVRELFRLYKTRIWMSCISGPLAGPTSNIVY
ncbi:hypothetical protein FRC15_011760 [Serendipita sp. 397]|nr:hypothetical protein FRC15_011760 [Serendipita sp. 397]